MFIVRAATSAKPEFALHARASRRSPSIWCPDSGRGGSIARHPVIALFLYPSRRQEAATGGRRPTPANAYAAPSAQSRNRCRDRRAVATWADPYTSHGHDGVMTEINENVATDETLQFSCRQALSARPAAISSQPIGMRDGASDGFARAWRRTASRTRYHGLCRQSTPRALRPGPEAVGSAKALMGRQAPIRWHPASMATRPCAMVALTSRRRRHGDGQAGPCPISTSPQRARGRIA